jgi:hypothetical protein
MELLNNEGYAPCTQAQSIISHIKTMQNAGFEVTAA